MNDLGANRHMAPKTGDAERFRPLGRHLVDRGVISQQDLILSLDRQGRERVLLGDMLCADGRVSRDQITDCVAEQFGLVRADLETDPPDPALSRDMPAKFWLRLGVIPWMRLGETTILATSRPDRMDDILAALPARIGPVLPVVADETAIQSAIARLFAAPLARDAEARVKAQFSCRHWSRTLRSARVAWLAGAVVLAGAALAAPVLAASLLCLLAMTCLVLIAGLKAAGFLAGFLPAPPPPPGARHAAEILPRISVMVPLFREESIAGALIERLSALTYPRALTDIILVLEEKDSVTRAALRQTMLPPWIRVIEVPDAGTITTKPRALNYALDFCRGEIVGIWDAEDAPAPDQLDVVAAAFAAAPPDVVCLQGMLDYYNPRTNWLSRCFTIEYASWFRVVLPGLARLGLVIPLGGTTLFLRRDKIEQMGGWDAHNVTEDADLGVRIARFGYRTEMIPTATWEEANFRPWPWIKQRSRWLKGFMVTYLVHMRSPGALLRDLGWKRFAALQAFFLGTLSQFLLAPVIWTFWIVLLGGTHPVQTYLGGAAIVTLAGLLLCVELMGATVAAFAVSGPRHRFLLPWIVTMPLYFPLGVIAAYKALYELATDPFYWDKTEHGHAPPEDRTA